MPVLSGTAEVECDYCRHSFQIDATDFHFEINSYVVPPYAPPGFDIIEGILELNCPKCQADIVINYYSSDFYDNTSEFDYSEEAIGYRFVSYFCEPYDRGSKKICFFNAQIDQKIQTEFLASITSTVSNCIQEGSDDLRLKFQKSTQDFENTIRKIFSQNGFDIGFIKRTQDLSRYIIGINLFQGNELKSMLECKLYSQYRPIDIALVRVFYGIRSDDGLIFAATSQFDPGKKKFSENENTTKWSMASKDSAEIRQWGIVRS